MYGKLPQRARRREIEHEADRLLHQFPLRVVPIGIVDRPRRLDPERGLEIGFGRLEVAQHQDRRPLFDGHARRQRSEEHTSELPSLMRISYAVLCLKTHTPPPTTP